MRLPFFLDERRFLPGFFFDLELLDRFLDEEVRFRREEVFLLKTTKQNIHSRRTQMCKENNNLSAFSNRLVFLFLGLDFLGEDVLATEVFAVSASPT